VPKHVACEEDDEFVALFDKMLNENIAESRNVSTRGYQCYKTLFFFVTDAPHLSTVLFIPSELITQGPML
jgi:hypothetical protein